MQLFTDHGVLYEVLVLLDSVPLLVVSVALVTAHVILTGLVVPDLAVVSTPVRPAHPQSRQHLHQWVVTNSHCAYRPSFFFLPNGRSCILE